MDDVRKPEMAADVLALSAQAISQAGAQAANQFWDRTQSVANMLMDLNAEAMRFMGRRLSQSSETMGRMAQSRSLPEVVDAELQWFRRTFDDYSEYGKRLTEFNTRLAGCVSRVPEPSEPAPSLAPAPGKSRPTSQPALQAG